MEWILGLHRCRLLERGVYLGMKNRQKPLFCTLSFLYFSGGNEIYAWKSQDKKWDQNKYACMKLHDIVKVIISLIFTCISCVVETPSSVFFQTK